MTAPKLTEAQRQHHLMATRAYVAQRRKAGLSRAEIVELLRAALRGDK